MLLLQREWPSLFRCSWRGGCRGTVLPHWALVRLLLWSLTTAEFWKANTVTWPPASDSSLACPRCMGSELYQPRKIRGTAISLFKSEQRMLPALIQKVILELSPSEAMSRAGFPKQCSLPIVVHLCSQSWSLGAHTRSGKTTCQITLWRFSAAISPSKHSEVLQ